MHVYVLCISFLYEYFIRGMRFAFSNINKYGIVSGCINIRQNLTTEPIKLHLFGFISFFFLKSCTYYDWSNISVVPYLCLVHLKSRELNVLTFFNWPAQKASLSFHWSYCFQTWLNAFLQEEKVWHKSDKQ